MDIKKILPIISIILGIISNFEGSFSLFGEPITGGNLSKIFFPPAECIGASEECNGFLYICILISLIGLILGIISLKLKLGKITSILGIILSLIGLTIWLFYWFLNWVLRIIPPAAQ